MFWLLSYLCVWLTCLSQSWSKILPLASSNLELHAGFYDLGYHKYLHNNPAPEHYQGPVPFGLPMGGYAKNGMPYGLRAYMDRGFRRRNG